MTLTVLWSFAALSLSARRAWIEIYIIKITRNTPAVALRKESVDRNPLFALAVWPGLVALRKESVDRNNVQPRKTEVPGAVALRKESVDRNDPDGIMVFCGPQVALRKESVDRNFCHSLNLPSRPMSLSARRAWIEI